MERNYRGIIFTNHAIERLKERDISQGDAWATFNNPDQSRYAASKGAWIYYKTYKDQKIEVVAKKNEKGEWLVISVWSRPIFKNNKFSKKSSDSFFVHLLKTIIGKA
jgi:predicted glutamine amidotransferase